MDELFSVYSLIVNVLSYSAIGIYLVTAKNLDERLQFLVALAGFFAIGGLVGDVLLAQFFIAAWLVLMNRPLMVPRWMVAGMLGLALVIRVYSPEFLAVNAALYVIILWGFVFGAFKKLAEIRLPGAQGHG